jgi:SAM-dependent MidA family methyltransferase
MLFKKIQREINENGPITFKKFMKMCLYDKEYGYYTGPSLPIGCSGDFVTSPHTGPFFGTLISRQLIEFYHILQNKKFSLIEMGAGSGYLAHDILSSLKKESLDDIKYIIIEPNDHNVIIQKNILRDFLNNIKWVKTIHDIASDRYCVISNELLDAFPVHLIQKSGGVFKEIYIDFDNKNKCFIELPGNLSSTELELYTRTIPSCLEESYKTEVNLNIKNWIYDVSKVITTGFVMTIDYGYTKNEYFSPLRNRGTLMAYKGQMINEDVLARPGEQDLTAHVNFSDLHEWGMSAGFKTVGYSPQWAFLGGLDFEEVVLGLMGGKIDPFSPKLAEIKALILPQGMGSSHKVMIQAKGFEEIPALKGFKIKNMINRL